MPRRLLLPKPPGPFEGLDAQWARGEVLMELAICEFGSALLEITGTGPSDCPMARERIYEICLKVFRDVFERTV